MTPGQVTLVFGPVAVLFCFIAYVQRRSWRQPPKSPQQARARAIWSQTFPMPQLGVRIGLDGFLYANASGRCLGQAGGATATVAPSVPVSKVKPSTGWATITFADGTTHRNMYRLLNHPEAQAQADKFNGLAKQAPSAGFRRTFTPAARP